MQPSTRGRWSQAALGWPNIGRGHVFCAHGYEDRAGFHTHGQQGGRIGAPDGFDEPKPDGAAGAEGCDGLGARTVVAWPWVARCLVAADAVNGRVTRIAAEMTNVILLNIASTSGALSSCFFAGEVRVGLADDNAAPISGDSVLAHAVMRVVPVAADTAYLDCRTRPCRAASPCIVRRS